MTDCAMLDKHIHIARVHVFANIEFRNKKHVLAVNTIRILVCIFWCSYLYMCTGIYTCVMLLQWL